MTNDRTLICKVFIDVILRFGTYDTITSYSKTKLNIYKSYPIILNIKSYLVKFVIYSL